ncbi:MAG TPA: hypothetical protein VL978_08830 [Puia sp.]|nr:hypothetical protein [Puia sp.]
MKIYIRYSFFLLLALRVHAQDTTGVKTDTVVRHTVALFLPLYLDSAFDATGNYRYDKNFPKFINPGLEFYEGAALALDSMRKEGLPLSVHIYDTRSATRSIRQVAADSAFDSTELIIGVVANGGEEQELAAVALKHRVPFINTNFPNDAGITANPDLVILNSTLRAHCEAIYRYLQRNYPTKPLIFFRKKGTQEDRLKGYFTDLDHSTAGVPLNIQYVTLDDEFDNKALTANMDSTEETVCIAGSLDENFGVRLAGVLAYLKSYPTVLIGMPTWDNIDYTKPELAGKEIVYTTPFYNNPADTLVRQINQYYKGRYYSRPSDMVFRGYECMYRWGHLLCLHGRDLGEHIGENKFKVFNDFNIEPVFLNRKTMTLDYFENKKLYFVHMTDGNVTAVN